jgi:peroxiredoxin
MSNRVAINSPAPDFTLADWQGNPVTLSAYQGQKHVVLVLNRGFS